MNIVAIISTLLTAALIAALVVLIRRMAADGRDLPITADWIDELSLERYQPMMYLLDRSDLEFMRTQPGFTPQATAKLRDQRCQIFRGYLKCFSSDFAKICGAIRLLMLQSGHDRPDLAAALVKHQLLFAMGLLIVNCRLVLYRFGICGVDVSILLKLFEVMRLELRTFVPAPASMGA